MTQFTSKHVAQLDRQLPSSNRDTGVVRLTFVPFIHPFGQSNNSLCTEENRLLISILCCCLQILVNALYVQVPSSASFSWTPTDQISHTHKKQLICNRACAQSPY